MGHGRNYVLCRKNYIRHNSNYIRPFFAALQRAEKQIIAENIQYKGILLELNALRVVFAMQAALRGIRLRQICKQDAGSCCGVPAFADRQICSGWLFVRLNS